MMAIVCFPVAERYNRQVGLGHRILSTGIESGLDLGVGYFFAKNAYLFSGAA
jgi:hypothetical protein